MNRIKLILGVLVAVVLLSCKQQLQKTSESPIKQGISGVVLWREGNFMPTINGNNNNKSIGIVRDVLIYELTNLENTVREGDFFKEIKTKLIKTVTSNPNGAFKADLPPGNYSIFIKEEGGLFANIYDGQNNVFPVAVDSAKVTEISVIVDYKAAY